MNERTNQPCMASIEIKFQAYNRSRWNNNEKVCTSYAIHIYSKTQQNQRKEDKVTQKEWKKEGKMTKPMKSLPQFHNNARKLDSSSEMSENLLCLA